MKKILNMFLKFTLLGVFIFTCFSTNSSYAATENSINTTEKNATCSQRNQEGQDITGKEKENLVKKTLKDSFVKDSIKIMKKEGYEFDKNQTIVKKVTPQGKEAQTNVVFTLTKSKDQYRVLIANDLGYYKIIDVDNGKVTEDYSLDNNPTPRVLCWACSSVCVALIGNPPAFASCVALCAVACGA